MTPFRIFVVSLALSFPSLSHAKESVCGITVDKGYLQPVFDGKAIGAKTFSDLLEAQKIVKDTIDAGACEAESPLPVCTVKLEGKKFRPALKGLGYGKAVYDSVPEAQKHVKAAIASGACQAPKALPACALTLESGKFRITLDGKPAGSEPFATAAEAQKVINASVSSGACQGKVKALPAASEPANNSEPEEGFSDQDPAL